MKGNELQMRIVEPLDGENKVKKPLFTLIKDELLLVRIKQDFSTGEIDNLRRKLVKITKRRGTIFSLVLEFSTIEYIFFIFEHYRSYFNKFKLLITKEFIATISKNEAKLKTFLKFFQNWRINLIRGVINIQIGIYDSKLLKPLKKKIKDNVKIQSTTQLTYSKELISNCLHVIPSKTNFSKYSFFNLNFVTYFGVFRTYLNLNVALVKLKRVPSLLLSFSPHLSEIALQQLFRNSILRLFGANAIIPYEYEVEDIPILKKNKENLEWKVNPSLSEPKFELACYDSYFYIYTYCVKHEQHMLLNKTVGALSLRQNAYNGCIQDIYVALNCL